MQQCGVIIVAEFNVLCSVPIKKRLYKTKRETRMLVNFIYETSNLDFDQNKNIALKFKAVIPVVYHLQMQTNCLIVFTTLLVWKSLMLNG